MFVNFLSPIVRLPLLFEGVNRGVIRVAFVQRVRAVLPDHHLLVDIDDGYGDTEVACHVVSLLESAGASGVILED